MDRKEIAKAIRKELKENGINNKQVSVTSKSATYDEAIRVNIKDLNVNYKIVSKIANKYESIRYDQANGEILAGGNMYVHVEFDWDAIQEAKQKYIQKAEELIEQNKNCSENESVTVTSKKDLTILYQPQWCNGNPQSIGLYRKSEGWENKSCYGYTNIKRYDAQCAESIAEALLMFSCQYGIDILETKENEIHKDEDNSKDQTMDIQDKSLIKSLNDIKETTKDLQWTIKNIYIKDNCIYAKVINKYGVEKDEGLYAGSDFSEEPTKQMYELLLKEFNLKGNDNTNITDATITDATITGTPKQTQENTNIQEENQETKQLTILDYVTIKSDINTKTKENIFVMKLKNKVEYEIFKTLETQIKSIDGYYSRFKRGFIFKEDPTEKLLTINVNILDNSNMQSIEYPEINIDDIETYTVSEELSKQENNNSMFRSHDIDHTKQLQKTLQSANNDVIELSNMPECTPYIEYKAKTYLQSFKKKYAEAYISTLRHRANNVSWMISGRSGLNISRYNKKQDQLTNKMKHECELIDNFNERIQQYKNKINSIQDKKELDSYLEAIKNIDISKATFTHVKIKIHRSAITDIFNNATYEVNAYKYKEYYILKNYGSFKIYNIDGQEIEQKYRDGTLKGAKTYLLYYLSNIDTSNKEKAM